jgi:hypothetical protein
MREDRKMRWTGAIDRFLGKKLLARGEKNLYSCIGLVTMSFSLRFLLTLSCPKRFLCLKKECVWL